MVLSTAAEEDEWKIIINHQTNATGYLHERLLRILIKSLLSFSTSCKK